GTAVGFALASGPATIFAVLTMLGLGLAAPFVVLALVPAWREMLPRPGPWLITLKQFLGFTLLATAVWLVWLLGQTTGPDGMASALAWSVALAIGVWLYGAAQFGEGARKWAALSFALLLVGGASAWALPLEPVRRSHDAGPVAEGGITWLEFSAERVDAELQKGRPVFVDFTADWCITCKVNERTVLTTDTVRSAIAEHDVAMVKADWTQRDDRIRSILASYGKAGVPMYLMYAPGQGRARVLPEVLTPSLVAGEMARAVAETDGFR
ncbi:MAG: thioredoxin family protein, partial [Myxococcota bacterium]